MMELWSWILTAFGITCFYLAGKKVWWAWYVGLAGQILWIAHAGITNQTGFIIGSLFYTVIYAQNAAKWTKERL